MLWRTILALHRTIFGKSDIAMVIAADCDHQWTVYSTARLERICLGLQCDRCGAFGRVLDPSKDEWSQAFRAPQRNYRWRVPARVVVS